MFYNGRWGSVCDNNWDIDDARVACRQLGFSDVVAALKNLSSVPDKIGPIWLDDVRCRGSESLMRECGHLGWGVHSCNHGTVAGIHCLAPGILYE